MKNTVLITGATSGIGKLLALKFAGIVDTLIICGRDMRKLKALLSEIEAVDRDHATIIQIVHADLRDADSVKRELINEVLNMMGYEPNIIIHSAAEFGTTALFSEIFDVERESLMKINYFAPAMINAAFIKNYFHTLEYGRIINIGSNAAIEAYPLRESYCASKHALKGHSVTLDKEFTNKYKFKNIRCFNPVPGPIEGERLEKIIAARAKTEKTTIEVMRKIMSKAAGGFLKPETVVNKILQLCQLDYAGKETIISFEDAPELQKEAV